MASPRMRRTPRARPALRSSAAAPVAVLAGVVALSLFLSGFCGIVSQLSLFNLAESLLGGTNANLTYTMGLMMFAMGLGSALTAHRWLAHVRVEAFILVECALSLVTMASVAAIYLLAGSLPGSAPYWIWSVSPLVGLLVGLEIPIVLRINEVLGLRLRLSAPLVMAPDYFGSLAAFVLFTFLLLPALGLARVAWLGGVLNLIVAGAVAAAFYAHLRRPVAVVAGFAVTGAAAVVLGLHLPGLMAYAEQLHYRDGIAWSKETPYQRLVVTEERLPGNPAYGGRRRGPTPVAQEGAVTLARQGGGHPAYCRDDLRLYINGGLQFSTCDEHRYHEMLVHPALALLEAPRSALVLGGGDGLAVRELLKHPTLEVTLVELDEAMVRLFRDDPRFARLNGGALSDGRVTIQVGDAFRFLREAARRFDLIVMDFPDPFQTGTARLYSTQFFRFALRRLAPGGALVTQSMSPLYHPRAFLSVRKTMEAAGFRVVSLQVPMLTFEHWGFQVGMADTTAAAMRARLEAFRPAVATRYLNGEAVQAALRWSKEMNFNDPTVPVNDLFTLPLAGLYRETLTGSQESAPDTDSP